MNYLEMISDIFKHDMAYINSRLEIGREPALDSVEVEAVNRYSMKRNSHNFTPLLR